MTDEVPRDLDSLRRELKSLTERRLSAPFSDEELHRYLELCAVENAVLGCPGQYR